MDTKTSAEGDELTTESQYLIKGMYANSFQDWKVLSSKLESISPFATLNRGYAICQTLAGDLIADIDQIEVNQKVKVRLRRGTILAQVEEGSKMEKISFEEALEQLEKVVRQLEQGMYR